MQEDLKLHPKYGLNPTMPICLMCQKELGTILCCGSAFEGEAPKNMITDVEPCEECRDKYLHKGVLVAEYERRSPKAGDCDYEEAVTGRCVVIVDESFKKLFSIEIPSSKICKISPEAFDKLLTLNLQKQEL